MMKIGKKLEVILAKARDNDIIRVCLTVSRGIDGAVDLSKIAQHIKYFTDAMRAEIASTNKIACSCTKVGIRALEALPFIAKITRPNLESSVWNDYER